MEKKGQAARAEAILVASAETIERLGRAGSWREVAPGVLEALGLAAVASRVYLFENSTREDGELVQDEAFEWTAPGIPTTIEDPENHGWPYSERMARYPTILGSGEVVHGPTATFPADERADLLDEGILSTAFVPVFEDTAWWGYLGFDDCSTEREWSSVEIAALRAGAAAIGSAIHGERLDEERRNAEERYRTVVEHIPAVTYLEVPEGDHGKTIYVSPQIESILGVTPQEWMGSDQEGDPWTRMLHPDDRDRVLREYELWRNGGPDLGDYRMIKPDGSVAWIRDRGTPVRDKDGALIMDQGFMFDITDQKQAEEELRESQEKYKALIEQLPAIIYIDPVDENEMSTYVSPQVQDMLGCTPEQWLTDYSWWHKHVHPEDEPRVWETYVQHRESGEPLSQEYRMVRDDERVVWIREQAVLLRNENGEPRIVHGLMYDITEQKQAEEQLAYVAQHDRLTDLPNRPMFEVLLDLALARAQRSDLGVAVLYLDLDNFKLVNDSLGHAAGDELIRQLSVRIREALRETDLVARHGSDEFLVLLADVDRGEQISGPDLDNVLLTAESVVTRIQDALASPFQVAGTEMFTTASIGVSLFPSFATDAQSLLSQADSATYRSKKAGPGGYAVFSPETSDALAQLSFTTRLRNAVGAKLWSLHYQPLVELASGRMIGVEALLRWEDPNAGFIPPGEFIPLAEEMGLIVAIGDWVMEELFRQAKAWQGQGIELDEISFNISPRQLWQPDLVQNILGHLDASSMDPGRIVIEITESAAMTDPERTQLILWELHGRGLRLAIDDFGTGYSSLSRLKHMPVSILKIDRAFVMDIPDDPDAGRMVSAIIGLAESLEVRPLAEGIETAEQRRFLVEKGCKLGQGYYFSRPVPAAGIEEIHSRGGITLMADDTAP